MLSPLLYAIAVDVIAENARRGVVNELLYVDDLVLMSKTTKDLKQGWPTFFPQPPMLFKFNSYLPHKRNTLKFQVNL